MSNFLPVSGFLRVRSFLPLALIALAGVASSASAQTAPQLLPYTAKLIAGGERQGSMVTPAILTGTKPGMKVRDEEAFGPVVAIEPYDDFEEALAQVNHSKYGLQAGLLTRDAGRILTAYRELEVGSLIVGDSPNWRLDPMPYGGVKESGLGREGIRFAMEEMTEPRMLVMTGIG